MSICTRRPLNREIKSRIERKGVKRARDEGDLLSVALYVSGGCGATFLA